MTTPIPSKTPPLHRRIGWWAVAIFVASLVLPVLALNRLSLWVDFRLLVAIPLVASVLAFVLYGVDKRRAGSGDRRIPESTLHAVALLGGWPGAFLAQRFFRHKTVKVSFQAVFWLIVAAHQLAALDYLNDGRFTRDLWFLLKSRFA